jgi:outer membrane receptor protein involved in Fe transport
MLYAIVAAAGAVAVASAHAGMSDETSSTSADPNPAGDQDQRSSQGQGSGVEEPDPAPIDEPDRSSEQQDARRVALPEDHHILETRVEALAPTSAASAETIRERDLILRPHATPEDILRVVPGLVIAQHQGGGKADQLFLRGFDADHGSDVAIFLDGVPINLPSHGHGQGYADLHFLIPEAIDRIELTKGPYYPEYGNFDTAGAVNLKTRRSFRESSVSGTYGSFSTYRVLGIASPQLSAGVPWLAAEVAGTQGPFDSPEELQRYNLIAEETLALNSSTVFSLLVSAYGSQWNASGQIPLRAVQAGTLGRFGSIDPTEGGQSQRQMMMATLEQQRGNDQSVSLTAYAVRYHLRLFSDFTFQLRDPQNFDEIEQDDARFYAGLNARFRTTRAWGSLKWVSTLGAQARYDDVRPQLWHVRRRTRLPDCFEQGQNPCSDVAITEGDLGLYSEQELRFGRWLRVVAGVRADLFEFNVSDQKPVTPESLQGPATSGLAQKAIVNPKLQVVLRPTTWWDIYLDGGGGFHSNDARSVIAAGGQGGLPRAWGGEIGTRLRLGPLDFAAALWRLHLQSEQVFSADEATTVPSAPTLRYGVDLEARWQILPWLWADGDLNLAHAAFTEDRGNGRAVALAPTRTATAGISLLHPDGYQGRLGFRHVGERPATQDESLIAQGYSIFDLYLGYRHKFWEVGVVVENLLDRRWREAQFANDSRLALPPHSEAAPVTDIHFTPGNPANVRATLSLFF